MTCEQLRIVRGFGIFQTAMPIRKVDPLMLQVRRFKLYFTSLYCCHGPRLTCSRFQKKKKGENEKNH